MSFDHFAWSCSDEVFHNTGPTLEAVLEEATTELSEGDVFYVGECRKPECPSSFFDVDNFIDHVSCQDDYQGDYAEDWDTSTKEQKSELESEVREVIAKWYDRHKLHPTHFIVDSVVQYQTVNGVPVEGKA